MVATTFVTAVYEAEARMQALQARSFAVHLTSADVGEIVVLDNTRTGMSPRARDELLAAYGRHRDSVRIVHRASLLPAARSTGWRSQQVLKLAIAESIGTSHYVTLDAKNHFVARPGEHYFVTADGRARIPAYSYATHPLRPALLHVLGYLGVPAGDHVEHFLATTTPFTFETRLVTTLIREVESASGRDFAAEFIANDLTEFFLYSGWLIRRAGRTDDVVETTGKMAETVWPGSAGSEQVEVTIQRALDSGVPLFAVHRNALPRLGSEAVARLADFWSARGLFASADEAGEFVHAFVADHARHDRRQAIRDVPARARTALRRARTRTTALWRQ